MKTSQAAFTLLEMIVVLAVMSMALVVILPALIRPDRKSVDMAAAEIAGLIRLTQANAVSSGSTKTLLVDFKQHAIADGEAAMLVPIDKEYALTVTFGRSPDSAQAAPAFRFFPDGQSTGGKIELTGTNEHRTIAVNWVTGAVTVSNP